MLDKILAVMALLNRFLITGSQVAERHAEVKQKEQDQDARNQIESDPAGWFDGHFPSVHDDGAVPSVPKPPDETLH